MKNSDSLIELLGEIKKRPAMYLTRNYISSLKAFLDGWFLRRPNEVLESELMYDFQNWIEKKYNITTTQTWASILLFYSVDECDALELFFKDFDLFLREKNLI